MTKKPNILLITTDTQRTDSIAAYGRAEAYSPNLDRLAARGVLFEEAYTASPVCMPARCSLMSGLHTPVHGCIENGFGRRDDFSLLPDLLEEAGYHNIMVGKTHFGEVPDSFHVQWLIKGEKNSENNDFYADYIRAEGYSRCSVYPNPVPEEKCLDAVLVDKIIAELDAAQAKDQPFFAFLSILSPHAVEDPPGRWDGFTKPEDLPELNCREGDVEKLDSQTTRILGLGRGEGAVDGMKPGVRTDEKSADEVTKHRLRYYDSCAYLDHHLGRLFDWMDENGMNENTLVIFTSDHGQAYYDHGFNDKHNFYDESWRIPFIMSMPGTLPAGEKRSFAHWNDIPVSICSAAGVDQTTMQGFDLFSEGTRNCATSVLLNTSALVTRNWKFWHNPSTGESRMFDRIQDPKEQHDLSTDPNYESQKDNLLNCLLTWRASLANTEFLKENNHRGGPVATRIHQAIDSLRGDTAERRLCRMIEDNGL